MIEAGVLPRRRFTADEIESLQTSTLVAASRGLGWHGVRVFVHHNHTEELELRPCTDHFLGVNLEPINHLFQAHGKRVHEAPLPSGESLLIPAGIACRWFWKTPTSGVNVYLEPWFVDSVAEELADGGQARVELIDSFGLNDPVLVHLALAMKHEIEQCRVNGRLYGDSLGTALTVHLLRNHSVFPPARSEFRGGLTGNRLQQVVDYIDENLGRDVSLRELSRVAQLSSSHFARAFKQSTGLPPHRYLLKRRVERSKELLTRPDATIACVSQELGFSDQSHFTAVFHRLSGMTPRQFLDSR
ncbi:MAG TPA: AraC family transcriptional regulator [Candidatus Binataceae bacterium]|nr:AraC family transcriptional regulator [Candidatus Binataceae bacterium]